MKNGEVHGGMIRILGISGSLRKGSYNRALVEAALEMLPDGVSMQRFDLAGIPLYNADLETGGDPDAVGGLKQAIAQADGLLIATPEYNYSVPGVLKNAIDWASRPSRGSVLTRKPIAIMGAGGRLGTVRAQMHLRQILLHNDTLLLGKPEVFIARAHEKFDAAGRLTDESSRQQIRKLLRAFTDWIQHWQVHHAS